jgi:hypothetical protein
MQKIDVSLVKKFTCDLLKHPRWTTYSQEDERYTQALVWGRTTLTFSAAFAMLILLGWTYFQLREEPYQRMMQSCVERLGVASCNDRWDSRRGQR